jgi:hypothetical protein
VSDSGVAIKIGKKNTLASSVSAIRAGADAVHRALTRLRSIDGLVTACLVEPDSAHVLDTIIGDAGTPSASGQATATIAAGASDVIQVIALMSSTLGEPDELEDVVITLGRRHHLITPLRTSGANGLLIVVTLDRAGTNLALARQQLRALGSVLESETGHVA